MNSKPEKNGKKNPTSMHIMTNLPKTSEKEIILKAPGDKRQVM